MESKIGKISDKPVLKTGLREICGVRVMRISVFSESCEIRLMKEGYISMLG